MRAKLAVVSTVRSGETISSELNGEGSDNETTEKGGKVRSSMLL